MFPSFIYLNLIQLFFHIFNDYNYVNSTLFDTGFSNPLSSYDTFTLICSISYCEILSFYSPFYLLSLGKYFLILNMVLYNKHCIIVFRLVSLFTSPVQVQYKYSTSTVPVQFKYITSTLQVQYKDSTSTVQVQYKYSTRTVQVQYKYSTSTVQVQYKYSKSTLQVQYKYSTVQVQYNYSVSTVQVQ